MAAKKKNTTTTKKTKRAPNDAKTEIYNIAPSKSQTSSSTGSTAATALSSATSASPSAALSTAAAAGLINIPPSRIRFQHSRIRPHFSGCGRSVVDTLEQIRRGNLSPLDLPPIQVLVGPDENDGLGPWYFSLNNRRLWVLKRCEEEGMLDRFNGMIPVRVRVPKSRAEVERYTIENCATEAKFMREKAPSAFGGGGGSSDKMTIENNGGKQNGSDAKVEIENKMQTEQCDKHAEGEDNTSSEDESECSDEVESTLTGVFNKFSSIMDDDDSESDDD
eukprot:CAMPEP_0171354782 /NCGR_PEP_ID=MMETSP0878-20121228/44883_1 /TAXON_ID=67004 /ORGANISM="Thalassiosira weissflogii, Strain CCMP1336" /LENGTH=276 /DNA_ID=CAMNT_0011860765 /DNA_START=406 /DNA_END=1236 /DNA_ORIENTATION=-